MRPMCLGGLRVRILDEAARFCRVAACVEKFFVIDRTARRKAPLLTLALKA